MIRALIFLTMISIFKTNLAIASSDKCDDGLLVVASGEAYRGGPKFSMTVRHKAGIWFSDIIEVTSARDTEFNPPYSPDEEPDWEDICLKVDEEIDAINEMSIYFGDEQYREFEADGEGKSGGVGDRNLFIKSASFKGNTMDANLGLQRPGCSKNTEFIGKSIRDTPSRLHCAGELILDWSKSTLVANNNPQQSTKNSPKENRKEWLDNSSTGATGSGKEGTKFGAVNNKAVAEARQFGQPEHPINSNPKVIVYGGHSIPQNTEKQPNEETLYYYYKRYNYYPRFGPVRFAAQPSKSPYQFQYDLRQAKAVNDELESTGLLSYLHFEGGKIVVDELVPQTRFGGEVTDETKLWSASIGKSMVSYLIGHAICEGLIDGLEGRLDDWPLLRDTLYYNQRIIDLLNMRAGDQDYMDMKALFASGIYPSNKALKFIMTEELKGTQASKAEYNYNVLPVNVLLNYVFFKSGNNFQSLMDKAFGEGAKTSQEVFFVWKSRSEGRRSLNRDTDYPATATFYATRHDYLRIALAMLNAWKSDSCFGKYLKDVFETSKRKGEKHDKPSRPNDFLSTNFRSYAGFFHTEYHEMRNRKLIQMHGYGGQHIWIDFDNSRIVATHAIHSDYNWKKIIASVVKTGKMKSGNWN